MLELVTEATENDTEDTEKGKERGFKAIVFCLYIANRSDSAYFISGTVERFSILVTFVRSASVS